jgi:hypothetical protein
MDGEEAWVRMDGEECSQRMRKSKRVAQQARERRYERLS